MIDETTSAPRYVLFVGEEENARKYFAEGLQHMFNIFTAGSVDDAIKIIKEHHKNIAVAITDQKIPGGNGLKLLRFLRENHPPTVRLLAAAHHDLPEAAEAVNTGEIFRYIPKPWDHDMLKTELAQAVEIFELRLKRFRVVREKIMVKRKMTKIERAKALILIARTLVFIRFSKSSMQNFIKKFAIVPIEAHDKNWNNFDFSKSETSETKFLLEIVEKLQAGIPITADYSTVDNFNYYRLSALLERIKSPTLQLKISEGIHGKINEKSLFLIIKNLVKIAETAAFMNIEVKGENLVINLKLEHFKYPQNDNIFIQNPEKPLTDFYINMMICYLMAGHHGGTVELYKDDQNLNCTIKLPYSEGRLDALVTDNDSSLENSILSTIVS